MRTAKARAGSAIFFRPQFHDHCLPGSAKAPFVYRVRGRPLAILSSTIDTSAAEFRANAEKMRGLVGDLQARRAQAALGGPEKSRTRHVGRGKLLPRDRVMNLIDPGSPFLELSPLAANGLYDDAIHGAGTHYRHRPHRGPRMHGRVQRLHHQRRHLFPDDGEETPARSGNRARKPAALHLLGGQRRRQSSASDRSVSRPRAFRPHFLQPGHALVASHSADRRGDGLLHRRRRLCAGDVGRDHHRARTRARFFSAGRRW
jgi:hypothetical protein